MSDDALIEFRKRVMDPISPTFCASKWYDAVIFLNEGRTKSCHHTPDHPINAEVVVQHPSALHNTPEKKEQRRKMLAGERPPECRYCWNVEDCAEEGVYPDRVPYTRRYSEEDIEMAGAAASYWNAVPRTLEVAFDRTCNFACSYCSPRFSTTWARDIKSNGAYVLRAQATYYGHDGSALAEPYGRYNEGNPYIAAFMEWWSEELARNLEQIRITGGEPIMSPWFWKWADLVRQDGVNERMLISVNSNLGAKDELIERLIEFTHTVPRFSLFTSCEASDEAAEYLRDGLDYERWLNNLGSLMARGNVEEATIMTTITAASLYSFTDFLDTIIHLRDEGGVEPFNILISFNLLKSPTFMSVLVLPQEMRDERADHLEKWLERRYHDLTDWERNGLRKVISYLREGRDPLWTDDLMKRMSNELDFYLFYLQYDERRGKSFRETFDARLVEWYDELAEQYEEDIAKYKRYRETGAQYERIKELPR